VTQHIVRFLPLKICLWDNSAYNGRTFPFRDAVIIIDLDCTASSRTRDKSDVTEADHGI